MFKEIKSISPKDLDTINLIPQVKHVITQNLLFFKFKATDTTVDNDHHSKFTKSALEDIAKLSIGTKVSLFSLIDSYVYDTDIITDKEGVSYLYLSICLSKKDFNDTVKDLFKDKNGMRLYFLDAFLEEEKDFNKSKDVKYMVSVEVLADHYFDNTSTIYNNTHIEEATSIEELLGISVDMILSELSEIKEQSSGDELIANLIREQYGDCSSVRIFMNSTEYTIEKHYPTNLKEREVSMKNIRGEWIS